MKSIDSTTPTNLPSLFKKLLAAITVFFLGAVAFGAARFVLVDKHEMHYHANFALYVNGTRDEFNSFVFYEEITACSASQHQNPKSRAHMHDKKNDLIHVHDDAVTWGHFFDNLGYTFTDGVLITPKGLYQNSSTASFTYILNGIKVSSIASKVIKSEDKLLINYGDEKDETIQERFNKISNDSKEYNEKSDPSTCSGGAPETLRERLIRTLFH